MTSIHLPKEPIDYLCTLLIDLVPILVIMGFYGAAINGHTCSYCNVLYSFDLSSIVRHRSWFPVAETLYLIVSLFYLAAGLYNRILAQNDLNFH